MRKNALLATVMSAMLLEPAVLRALITTNFWNGSTGSEWSEPSNWDSGLPSSSHQATIPGSNPAPHVGDIDIRGDAAAYILWGNSGTYAFNIHRGGSLSVSLAGNCIYSTGSGTRTINILDGGTLSTTLNFSRGIIELVPQGSYVPQLGDTYTLWVETVAAASITSGDGSNIVIQGHPDLALDTSAWAVSGTLTVIPGRPAGTLVSVR